MRLAVRDFRFLLVIALAFGLMAGGCQRASQAGDQAPEVGMTLDIAPVPAAVGPAQLTITLVDGSGQAIEGASLRVKGDMAHAGMVPVRATATDSGGGLYLAELEWTMGGDWIVTVLATLPDGRITSRQFDLSVAGQGPTEAE